MALPALRSKTEHLYELCEDPDCPRFPCRVYKEGLEAGFRRGYDAGYADGFGAGYATGFAAGMASGG